MYTCMYMHVKTKKQMLNCKIKTGILRELTRYIQVYGKNASAWTSQFDKKIFWFLISKNIDTCVHQRYLFSPYDFDALVENL